MSQIAINQKKEETDRLREYIVMEQEKLLEAKKYLEESKEKFAKTLYDSEKASKDLVNQVREATNYKKLLQQKIDKLQNMIGAKDTKISQCEDELVECRTHKHFLDILAIQAGKKKYQPKT